ncbi:hypothetical protein UY3_10785 [Chelonia mydas]|uniref:Uncharacterized protein n=1 Tax=Chelonia mydas TaxID=8469 RepID=M7B4N1_CHEMY|nr:hypothetical protein UY3_10785 [Chelonia mydas]
MGWGKARGFPWQGEPALAAPSSQGCAKTCRGPDEIKQLTGSDPGIVHSPPLLLEKATAPSGRGPISCSGHWSTVSEHNVVKSHFVDKIEIEREGPLGSCLKAVVLNLQPVGTVANFHAVNKHPDFHNKPKIKLIPSQNKPIPTNPNTLCD